MQKKTLNTDNFILGVDTKLQCKTKGVYVQFILYEKHQSF